MKNIIPQTHSDPGLFPRKPSHVEDEWQMCLDVLGDGLAILDLDRNIIRCNKFFKKLLVHPMTEVIGQSCCNLMRPAGEQPKACPVTRMLNSMKRETWQTQINHQWFDVIADPILDENGRLKAIAHVFKDVTARHKIEDRYIRAQKMESIGTLAGGIAHDFNNILFPILGYTELAMDKLDEDSVVVGYLQEIYRAGKRAKELIEQILTFSRKTDAVSQPVRVDSILKETLKFMRSSTPASIQIEQKICSKAFIMGNPSQLHQIIMNLCVNAIQAMEEKGGILHVHLEDEKITENLKTFKKDLEPGHYVKLTISDTGVGMAAEQLENIFEPYFTTKSQKDGTGLGLSVTYGIVEHFGGRIQVSSEPGKGSVFTVYLSKTHDIHPVPPPSEYLLRGQERILLVDDEPAIVRMATGILNQLGYTVTPETDPTTALDTFKTHPQDFDLVISDVTMPKMSGVELAALLNQIRPDIPVILSTGFSKNISDTTMNETGIKAITTKPLLKADLAATIRKVLDEPKAKP